MTSRDLSESFQNAITLLQNLREEVGLIDLDLEDGPQLHGDARRFAAALEIAPDARAAKSLLMADRAGAQAFWYLVRTRWETMGIFLMPSAFELHPNPRPFETLCRCEWWLEETSAPAQETASAVYFWEEADAELEWEASSHTGEMPGVPRPVRAALEAPEFSEEVAVELDLAGGEPPRRAALV
jgi:hypothetical protein